MSPDPAPTPADQLIALCDRLCDGRLTADERERLEALVLGDPALRRLYVEQLHLHAQLRQNSARFSDAPLQAVLRPVTPAQRPAPRWFRSRWAWNTAAAAVLVVLVGGWWSTTAARVEVAVLQEARNARWANSTLPTEPGSVLTAGHLRLVEGLARVRFRDGAEVTLEGPGELELITRELCRLHSGSLVAHVPPAARGFTVLTADATLIDHGTDFGISTNSDGHASVHVMQGEVELRHRQGGSPLHLLTQQMAAIDPSGLHLVTALTSEPDNQTPAPAAPVFTHELTTATGHGAASYVTSPGTEKHFSDTLLLLKNAPTRTFLRKAIVRFDLSTLTLPEPVQAARLTLHFDATGFGFAALGGDACFAVYAVTDDLLDAWSPERLEWATMPAFDDDPGRVDGRKAVRVGDFTMPSGLLRAAMSIDGSALVERIRHDGNRLLTLIIVRENPLELAAGVVHGFAGNRHPTLPPPTLRLR